MNATITNTPAAFARAAFEKAKSLHEQCQSEIAAGRFIWSGPSICPKEGDGVSEKVASNQALRASYAAATNSLNDHLDRLVAEETGFGGSFIDLVEAQQKNGYRPSFYERDNPAVAVLADAYDFVATLWGLPLTSYRPQQEKPQPAPAPEKLTLQSIKDKLRKLRDESHPGRIKNYPYVRSGGHEFRLGGDNNTLGGYYEYYGSWNGTLRDLKDAAERCKSKGGDSVEIGGQWLCCDTLDGDYEPCDGSEWFLELTPDEILAIGKKS